MGGGAAGSDPLQQMAQQMMQNPEMMRSAMNMMQGMNGGTNQAQGGEGAPPAANPFGGFNPFAAMGGMSGMGGMGAPPQAQDTRPPEEQYATQLQQLNAMGFYEFERNVRALRMSGGSVEGAVEHLLSG
jgi:ubiquilin